MSESTRTITVLVVLVAAAIMISVSVPAQANETRTELRNQAGVYYLSGGIGIDQREELSKIAAKETMNLKLEFAQRDGAFLSAVPVTITDASVIVRLQLATDGPWLFVRLPAGEYRFRAERNGKVQTGSVTVTEKERTERIISFP
jgi:hypothetical protein